ncbi:MAG: helix-turn-helix transcriptional regulator [Rhodobacteraceae bacterium]|nr:helix-turn-helix transcriptional regulator [Paracoccaceae bacterium]
MTKTSNPDIYRPIDVPESLKPYVRRILIADSTEQVDMLIDVCATGYHYLGWVWRGRWQGIVNGETRFDSDIDGPIHLSGQVNKSEISAGFQRDLGQIFLEFSALGHFQLLGITGAKMLEDAAAPHVLNPGLKPHLEKIFGAGELPVSARMALLADVLSRLPKHVVSDKIVTAVERIEAVDGDIRLADLVDELGLAERQFRTDFKTLIGLTPKAFCKVLQINQALNQLLASNGGDLAGVAAETGFSDQAHFTRAFRDFLGKTPRGYLKNVEITLARFAGQSRQ